MSRKDYGSGSIVERAPGVWLITVPEGVDASGKRVRRRFTVRGNKTAALKAKTAAMTKRDTGKSVPKDKITLAEWMRRWLPRHIVEKGVRPATAERYRGIMETHIIPALGSLSIQQLRTDHIPDAKAQWLSGEKPLTSASVHKHLVILRMALAEALLAGVVERNAMDGVKAPSVKLSQERRALTETEIIALLDTASTTRFNAPIRFTLATGVREGELLGLRWSDVDFERSEAHVRQTLSYVGGKVRFGPPKTDRARRVIELSPATVQLLRSHRAAQTEHRLRLGLAWRDTGLVFPSLRGTPWIPRTFYRDFRAVVDASDISNPEGVNFHCLRHSAASHWIRAGADIFSVSRRLGHEKPGFTMAVYGHLFAGQQKQAAEALDALIAQ